MGCDIHLYVEVKTPEGWRSADKWSKEDYGEDGSRVDVDYDDRFYRDRNYDLFAILADVRNGRGFAGCDTGDGFKPIAAVRGLPQDVSPDVKASSDRWDCDGHSHSWLTVAELLAYDWTQVTNIRGLVSASEYVEWCRWRRRSGEPPESYCGGTSGTVLSEDELKAKTETIKSRFEGKGFGWWKDYVSAVAAEVRVYAPFELAQPYYKCARSFWSDCIPRLLHLGKPEDVRIVFWFDN